MNDNFEKEEKIEVSNSHLKEIPEEDFNLKEK